MFDHTPAVHIRREYERPPSLRQTMARYLRLIQHYDNHGIDPRRQREREQLLARGPARISPIAVADGPLPIGRIALDKRRRVWRFRACVMETGRCVFQRFVEGETVEEARIIGARMMTQEWDEVLRATNGQPPAALVGSAIAI